MKNVRSLVLCAGFGQRLRPLTDQIPKPCLPFFGLPILDFILQRLQESGIKQVGFNLHHLPDQIQDYVKACPWSIDPYFSLELPSILNTGGALAKPLMEWLENGEALVVLNGDVLTDIDLDSLIKSHLQSDALATVAVLPGLIPGEPRCLLHQDGNYLGLAKTETLTQETRQQAAGFACVYIVNKTLAHYLKPNQAIEIFDVFSNALQAGERINVFEHRGHLFDLGTPERIWNTHRFFLKHPQLFKSFHFDAVFQACGRDYQLFLGDDQVVNRQKGPIQPPVFWSHPEPIPRQLQLGPDFIYAGSRPFKESALLSHSSKLQESIILDSVLSLETPLHRHLVIKDIVFPINS